MAFSAQDAWLPRQNVPLDADRLLAQTDFPSRQIIHAGFYLHCARFESVTDDG